MTILGLIIASAIPVVMLALWCEYFRNEIREEDPIDTDDENAAMDRLTRVRIAGLLATTLQLVVFLATSSIRREEPAAAISGLWITLAALVAQRWLQLGVERELLPKEASAQLRVIPPTALWGLGAVFIYMGILAGFVTASALAVLFFKLSGAPAAAVIGLGSILGYSLALASNFVLSPWILKRMLPSREMDEGRVKDHLLACFKSAGVAPPEFRIIDSERIQTLNAWVSGFPRRIFGIGPVLWMTPKLFQEFSTAERREEFEAIIKHEAAHMKAGHLAGRFLLAWGMSLVTLLTVAAALAWNAVLRGTPVVSALPLFSLFASLGIFWGALRILRRQARQQELEADRMAIVEFGASAVAMRSAILEVERRNAPAGSTSENHSVPSPFATHPGVAERLQALEPLIQAEISSQNSEQRKAA